MISRTIWSLWLQGWDAAPEIVLCCRRTWERLNPSWSIQRLDRPSLYGIVPEWAMRIIDATPTLSPEALSDIVRIALLDRYGGVWADSTTYCVQPLDTWLSAATPAGFFAFARPGPDRMISSWFLAAAPGNVLVKRWAELTQDYWAGRSEPDEYFWFHYLFGVGYERDAEWRAVWNATPEITAHGPHRFLPYSEKLPATVTRSDRDVVEQAATPMFKLTHKLPGGPYAAHSVIRYLCDRSGARA